MCNVYLLLVTVLDDVIADETASDLDSTVFWGPHGVLGIWGEWLFLFRQMGSTGYHFRNLGSKLIF